MTKLYILRGVPGSGKSTWAADQTDVTVVNRDSIRFALYGKYWGVNEDVVTQVEDAAINAALAAGEDTVVDATNLRARSLKTKLSLASRHGAEVEYLDFPISLLGAITRDNGRDRKVGADVIAGFFKRYKIDTKYGTLPVAPEPWSIFEPYYADTSCPPAYIVDTDGTVANHEGVRGIYDTSKYHLDTVHVHVKRVVQSLSSKGYEIIGLSGRSEEFADVTKKWWMDNSIPFDKFFFRPHEDGAKTVDAVVKYNLFNEHISPYYNVLGAFDDRPQVIRMWEAIGVPVFDVGGRKEF